MTEHHGDDFAFPTAGRLVEGFAAGDISPEEATRAALERAADLEPHLNAFAHIDHDGAMAAAAQAGDR